MSPSYLDSGRIHQKMRTRRALLQATRDLLDEKQEVTIDSVAEKALVSRATAYRYYSSVEDLVMEAVVETRITEAAQLIEQLDGPDAKENLKGFQRIWLDFFAENEPTLRKFLSISQERWLKQPDKAEVRGNRRIEGFELLLDRSGDHISDKEKRRLKFALCVLTSLEALIVLKDSCQLSQAEAREVLDWATNILLRAVLPDPD